MIKENKLCLIPRNDIDTKKKFKGTRVSYLDVIIENWSALIDTEAPEL